MMNTYYIERVKNVKQHIGPQDEVLRRFKQQVLSVLASVTWHFYLRDNRPDLWNDYKEKHAQWEWASLCSLFEVFRYSTYKGEMHNYDAWKEHILLAADKLLKEEVLTGETELLWKQFEKWLGMSQKEIRCYLSLDNWELTKRK